MTPALAEAAKELEREHGATTEPRSAQKAATIYPGELSEALKAAKTKEVENEE